MDRVIFQGRKCSNCQGEVTFAWGVNGKNQRYYLAVCGVCDLVFSASIDRQIKSIFNLSKCDLPRWYSPSERTGKARTYSVGIPGHKARSERYTVALQKGHTNKPCSDAVRDQIKVMRALPYDVYLQTPHWKSTRQLALQYAGYRCQLCDAKGHLNVHHRTYDRLAEERVSDLTVLCRSCHAKFHDKEE